MKNDALETAFIEAIESGDVEETRRLLVEFPELIQADFGGITALHAAASGGNIALMKLLIESGADVNAEEDFPNRGTPLLYSMVCDNPDVARFLLEQGANPNHGREVLRAITGNKSNTLQVIKVLEQHGADLHRVFVNELSTQQEKMNALSTAIAWRKDDVVEYLRSRGAVLP